MYNYMIMCTHYYHDFYLMGFRDEEERKLGEKAQLQLALEATKVFMDYRKNLL